MCCDLRLTFAFSVADPVAWSGTLSLSKRLFLSPFGGKLCRNYLSVIPYKRSATRNPVLLRSSGCRSARLCRNVLAKEQQRLKQSPK